MSTSCPDSASLTKTTIKESPHLLADCEDLFVSCFPKFVTNPNLDIHMPLHSIGDLEYIVILMEKERVVAFGIAVPFYWSGDIKDLPTFDQSVRCGLEIQSLKKSFNSLNGYAICVSPDQRGKGLAKKVISEMKSMAKKEKCSHLLIPARPSRKHMYPLQSCLEYSKWRRNDGKLVDDWLRIHENLGAKYLLAMEDCDVYAGPLDEWSESTGMIFPQSGSYIVPGALSPLIVDIDKDIGMVREGNVWMSHPID